MYILNTKTSRAFTMKQPSGDGCRCWEPGGRDDRMRDAIRDEVRARLEAKRREHLYTHMMALYKRGCTDTEIAERCGVGLGAVKHWRRTRMLPVNAARTTGYDLYRELYEQACPTDKWPTSWAYRLGECLGGGGTRPCPQTYQRRYNHDNKRKAACPCA